MSACVGADDNSTSGVTLPPVPYFVAVYFIMSRL